MATDPTRGKKYAFAIASTLAWLTLLTAFLATVTTMALNNANYAGNAASKIVQHVSKNPATINSLLDEFKKTADPTTADEIDKNRTAIVSTIASLGQDKAFQDSLAKTLNKITEAIFSGSRTVTIDFVPLATSVADKVNAAAKSPVISQKELAKLKPTVLDLSSNSTNISDVRNRSKEVTLVWLLWFVLLGVLYLLKQWKFLRTAGWQLFSVGILFWAAHFVLPVIVHDALDNSTTAAYQKDLIPEVLKSLTSPLVLLSTVVLLAGVALLVVDQLVQNRLRPKTTQMSPSVVA